MKGDKHQPLLTLKDHGLTPKRRKDQRLLPRVLRIHRLETPIGSSEQNAAGNPMISCREGKGLRAENLKLGETRKEAMGASTDETETIHEARVK